MKYILRRCYIDQRHWVIQADEWAAEHGEEIFIQWPTNSITRMHGALDRYLVDLTVEKTTTHDDCAYTKQHAVNAIKVAKPAERYILGKPSPNEKIDVFMSDILAHEAAADHRAAGWPGESVHYVYFA